LNEKVNTGVYLTIDQYDRLQAMAKADNRSASNFIGQLIDREWARYMEEKKASPTEK
jgi:hypothetical protein